MGLRGRNAVSRKQKDAAKHPAPAWKRKRGRVNRLVCFLESLEITKGKLAGQRLTLTKEQREFIQAVYGSSPRTVRLAISSIPRGGGKTTFCAALTAAHLYGPEAERRGECYSAASDKLQAGLLYKELVAFIEADPAVAARVNVQRFHKVVEVLDGPGAGSSFEALSSDAKRPHGLAPSFFVCDEPARSKTAELFEGLQTGMGKRDEALGLVIGTQAGVDQHWYSELIDDALLGEEPSVFIQLLAADKEEDPFAEDVWHRVNPALAAGFLDLGEFRSEARRAKRSPSFLPRFQNLRLNMRVDAETEFISDADWMACKADLGDLKGHACFAGLDLSQTTDMTALVLYFPHNGAVVPFFWLPQEGLLERDQKEGVHYRTWQKQGLLETTPGAAINFVAVIRRLAEIATEYDLKAVAYDRAYIKTFQAQLDREGVVLPLAEFGQGWVSMSPAVQILEAAVLDKRISHDGNPILRWHMSNVAITADDAGNRKPTKKRSRGHIDGVVALMMAMGHAAKTVPKKPSVYATRGLVTVGLNS
jgi:phage terminase large subunit-like protein